METDVTKKRKVSSFYILSFLHIKRQRDLLYMTADFSLLCCPSFTDIYIICQQTVFLTYTLTFDLPHTMQHVQMVHQLQSTDTNLTFKWNILPKEYLK